jgi:hypothetical protein
MAIDRRRVLNELGDRLVGYAVEEGAQPVTSFDLQSYMNIHLRYEMKFLLAAATTWVGVHDEADRHRGPPHLVEMAMESAFVHTRVLYEFIGREGDGWKKKRHRSPHSPVRSELWDEYKDAMHQKVLHPDPSRPYQPTGTPADELKDRVLDLAQDVLDRWDDVANQSAMEPYRELMADVRHGASRDAAKSAVGISIAPVFG